MDVRADWYEGFFESHWLDEIALRIPKERTAEQVEFLIAKLGLDDGASILDLACGHGRIALELARRGYRVTGLDLSPRSLQFAREAAASEELHVEWVQADMRDIPAGAMFDAVANVFTSFGFFREDDENQRVLDGVARALVPGGAFLIDVVNLLGLVRRYRDRGWEERDSVFQLNENEFDFLGGRNHGHWTFIWSDGTRSELVHSVRTYAPHELASMLARAGLEVKGAWGDWDTSELSFESRRLILLARKPL